MTLDSFIVSQDSSIKLTLQKINSNCKGLCFVTNNENQLFGVVTDGDIRRGLISGMSIESRIVEVTNRHFTSLSYTTADSEILEHLSDKVKVIPLVDENNYIVDYATLNKLRRIPIANPVLDGNELSYVTECIKTNWVSSQGKFVNRFEEQFSELMQGQKAVAVSNGTVALHLALVALGIGPGDEVILPDLTFAATINAVLYTGASPVIVDVDPITWCIDPVKIEQAVGPNTKAILPVHLYGHPVNIKSILDIARRHKLIVIEDCAEALGSEYYGKPVGYFADASTFSFYGNKTITTGEGGMVLFQDAEVADKARTLRDHGMSKDKKYWHDSIGFNYRLTNMQAALGVAQMERLTQIVDKKVQIAGYYTRYFSGLPGIAIHAEASWAKHSYWMYCIRILPDSLIEKTRLIDFLFKSGIETRPVFYPLSSMPVYSKYRFDLDLTSQATNISETGLCLPSSLDIDQEVVHRIVEQINSFVRETV